MIFFFSLFSLPLIYIIFLSLSVLYIFLHLFLCIGIFFSTIFPSFAFFSIFSLPLFISVYCSITYSPFRLFLSLFFVFVSPFLPFFYLLHLFLSFITFLCIYTCRSITLPFPSFSILFFVSVFSFLFLFIFCISFYPLLFLCVVVSTCASISIHYLPFFVFSSTSFFVNAFTFFFVYLRTLLFACILSLSISCLLSSHWLLYSPTPVGLPVSSKAKREEEWRLKTRAGTERANKPQYFRTTKDCGMQMRGTPVNTSPRKHSRLPRKGMKLGRDQV